MKMINPDNAAAYKYVKEWLSYLERDLKTKQKNPDTTLLGWQIKVLKIAADWWEELREYKKKEEGMYEVPRR